MDLNHQAGWAVAAQASARSEPPLPKRKEDSFDAAAYDYAHRLITPVCGDTLQMPGDGPVIGRAKDASPRKGNKNFMMKKKHIIAKLLVLAMILTMIPFSAMAAGETETDAKITAVTIDDQKFDLKNKGAGTQEDPYVFSNDTYTFAVDTKLTIQFTVSPAGAKVYEVGSDTALAESKTTYKATTSGTKTLEFYVQGNAAKVYYNVALEIEKSSSGSTGGGGGGSSKPSIRPGDKPTTPTTPGTTAPSGGVAGFNDVATGAWYADSVKYVVEKGLFGGMGDGNFAPNANMTRAMMWTVLARYMGVNTNTGSNWYEAARAWAIEKGISDGTMADGNVTREQFVTMLWRLSGEPTVDNGASFTDSGKVSGYAKTAVDWAVAQGIVNGYNDGSFNPQGSATRAEVAKMLTVFCTNADAAGNTTDTEEA